MVCHLRLALMVNNGGKGMRHAFDPRMTAYFGEAVLCAGFLPTPHLFMRHYVDLGLDSTLAMFVLQLMETTWDLGTPPKTSRDFAQRMGVGTKAIQRYTSRIEALGLVNVIAQFDASGAQIENRYDLSPLFNRLAAIVSSPSCPREQRRPAYQSLEEQSVQASCQLNYVNLEIKSRTSLPHEHPAGRQQCPGAPDHTSGEALDQVIREPGIARSGLKETLRIINKQQDHALLDARGSDSHTPGIPDHADTSGVQRTAWSIRQQRALTPDEIAASQTLLTRMAIDNPVRTRIAERMSPEDIWALRVYSAAKRWSPALTVTQVYDKWHKQVQIASDLEPEHYEIGAMLNALDRETAEAAIDLVLHCCPQAPQRLESDSLLAAPPPALVSVVDTLWRVIARLRGCPQTLLQIADRSHERADGVGDDVIGNDVQLWRAVLKKLQACIPQSEFATWLELSVLLDLSEQGDQMHGIIGVSNIFAREYVAGAYAPLIAHALGEFLGKPATVQVELACASTTTHTSPALPLKTPGVSRGQARRSRGSAWG
jgi:hypothetical protein